MTTIIIIVAIVAASSFFAFKKALNYAKKQLSSMLKELQEEKALLGAQKDFILRGLVDLTRLDLKAEQELVKIQKNMTILQAMADKVHDPKWIEAFNKGRENARFN